MPDAARRRRRRRPRGRPRARRAQDVVALLREQGLTRCDGFVGNLLLRGTGAADDLLAGEYTVTVGTPLEDIVDAPEHPARVGADEAADDPRGPPDPLDVPGGAEHRQRREGAVGLSAERFADLAESGRFALPPYLPEGTATAEGFLFPETYQLVREGSGRGRGRPIRCSSSSTARREGLPWEHAEDLGVTPYEAVIVASMVEREAQVDRERPLIAGVIYERLRRGMALGIDATLLYDDPTPDGELSTRRHRDRQAVQHADAARVCRRRRSRPRARPRSSAALEPEGLPVPVLRALSEGGRRRASLRPDLRPAPRERAGVPRVSDAGGVVAAPTDRRRRGPSA